jgi:hypothetical protein
MFCFSFCLAPNSVTCAQMRGINATRREGRAWRFTFLACGVENVENERVPVHSDLLAIAFAKCQRHPRARAHAVADLRVFNRGIVFLDKVAMAEEDRQSRFSHATSANNGNIILGHELQSCGSEFGSSVDMKTECRAKARLLALPGRN